MSPGGYDGREKDAFFSKSGQPFVLRMDPFLWIRQFLRHRQGDGLSGFFKNPFRALFYSHGHADGQRPEKADAENDSLVRLCDGGSGTGWIFCQAPSSIFFQSREAGGIFSICKCVCPVLPAGNKPITDIMRTWPCSPWELPCQEAGRYF